MDVVLASPTVAGATFWDPVPFSWPILLILAAICLLLTLAFVVWTVLQPEEPAVDTTALVDDAVRKDRERAATIRRRLDADTGRADTSEPELR
ncbi:hypothetical protein CFK41_15655 [Brachybacterium ginsengisoli]|uniref:Uncharacterized protein n=1 Tax=Brachybacterium ginsengisoli TaxID=1331682 RepID=A0A291H0T0_9MICO|nr:hypothetical protein [Brachybacterium ginsengisoli]ATG56055.1 hypothetical protein CFK41_15655 [Brachybacterium ginsengisoli]